MRLFLLTLCLVVIVWAEDKPVEQSPITPEMKKDYWKMIASKIQLESQAVKAFKDLEAFTLQLAQTCEKAGKQLAGDATGDPTCTPKQAVVKPEEKKEK